MWVLVHLRIDRSAEASVVLSTASHSRSSRIIKPSKNPSSKPVAKNPLSFLPAPQSPKKMTRRNPLPPSALLLTPYKTTVEAQAQREKLPMIPELVHRRNSSSLSRFTGVIGRELPSLQGQGVVVQGKGKEGGEGGK